MPFVDLNCDLGDSEPAIAPATSELLSLVTSVNIACGVHAGTPLTVAETVRLAARSGVAIGAHPGLPDRAGDGRRTIAVSAQDAHALVLYQVAALEALVKAEGSRLTHVKPHGALYNMASTDRGLADAIAAAVKAFDPGLRLIGLSGSELLRAAGAAGLRAASEVFADRSYQADGTLTPRRMPDAILADEAIATAQATRMVLEGRVRATSGTDISVLADTVCLHGDGPHAVGFARRIRDALKAAGIEVRGLA
jgi:UPF0271 protein